MNVKPIRTKAAYKQAMARIDALWGGRAWAARTATSWKCW
jgi:hypothetical protein